MLLSLVCRLYRWLVSEKKTKKVSLSVLQSLSLLFPLECGESIRFSEFDANVHTNGLCGVEDGFALFSGCVSRVFVTNRMGKETRWE